MRYGLFIIFSLFFSCFGTASSYAQLAEVSAFDTTENDRASSDRIFVDALKEQMLGNHKEAEVLLRRFIDKRPDVAAAYFELAKINIKQNNPVLAKQNVQHAIRLDKDNKWYQEMYANLLATTGQYAEAAGIFSTLADHYQPNEDYRLKSSLLYERASEPDSAVAQLERLLKLREGDEDLLIQISQIYEKQKRIDKAAVALQRLIDAHPQEGRYYGILADLYMKNGRAKDAEPIFQKAEKQFPNDISIQLGLAAYYRRKQDTAMYFRYINKAIENTTIDPQTQLTLLISYLQEMGKDTLLRDNALQVTERMVEKTPDNATLLNILGDLYSMKGQQDKASQAYKRSLDIDAANLSVWQQFLFGLTMREQADSLLYYADQALSFYPSSAILYYLKGIAYNHKGMYEKAVNNYQTALDYQPEDNRLLLSEIHASMGDAYNSMKNYAASDHSYDEALKLNPENATVLNNYAYYLSLRKERLEHAQKLSEKSLEIRPGEATFLDTYGWILYQKGDYSKAKKAILQAIEKNEEGADATLYEHLGDVCYRLKDIESAVLYWQKALVKDPENTQLQQKVKHKKIDD